MVFIYILKLENEKYYVGKTLNPIFRIKDHFEQTERQSSAWTKMYKPTAIEKIIPNCDSFDEDKITKIYMKKYGISNVRGGSYVKITLEKEVITLLQKEIDTAENNCFNCGKKGHYIAECPDLKPTELWHSDKSETGSIIENTSPIIVFCEPWCFCRKNTPKKTSFIK